MASNTFPMTVDIRRTKKYVLYQGYGLMKNNYSVIKLKDGFGDTMKIATNWMTEIQKDELMKHEDDDDFDRACSKLDYS
jgi:hypothetical protein